jgi:hypothetical protein
VGLSADVDASDDLTVGGADEEDVAAGDGGEDAVRVVVVEKEEVGSDAGAVADAAGAGLEVDDFGLAGQGVT